MSPRLSALAALVAVAAVAVAEDPKPAGGVVLRLKFEKDKTFFEEVTTETQQTMKLLGADVAQQQKLTLIWSWTPRVQDKDQNWLVKQKIEGVQLDADVGGLKVSFDTVRDLGAITPLADFFKALLGSELTLTVAPDCRLVRVEGRDEIIKRLVTANQQMEGIFRHVLSPDAVKQMAEPILCVGPGGPVQPGATWTRTSKLSLGSVGTFETNSKYTYAGKDAKQPELDRITVVTSMKYLAPADASGGALPFKIKKADLKSNDAPGVILFDRAKGRVASSTLELKLEGRLDVEAAGMTTEVEIASTHKTTLKTSDDNPLTRR